MRACSLIFYSANAGGFASRQQDGPHSDPEPCSGFCGRFAQSPAPSPATTTKTGATDPGPGKPPDSGIVFDDAAQSSGIDFVLRNSLSPQRYSIETMLGGLALFDYNNDGRLDIFFTNGAAIPSLEKSNPGYWNRLYRNNGDGTFTDVTEQAGVQGVGYSMGVAAGDYDNDGFVDLYITGVNRNQLLRNNGNGTFTDVTEKAGVGGTLTGKKKPWAVAAGWFDANHTGRLDLLVINYLDYSIADAKLCSIDNVPTYCAPGNFKGTPNLLYRNNGDGTFYRCLGGVAHRTVCRQRHGSGVWRL